MGGAERFLESARLHGHALKLQKFPDGTKTAEDAARSIGCELGQIVKSIVFLADGEPILALASGVNRVDTAKLVALADVTSVRRADADEVRAATGYAVGGTPPFGYTRHIRTFIDADLMEHDEVWAGAGAPDSVFAITPDELVRASGGAVVDLRER